MKTEYIKEAVMFVALTVLTIAAAKYALPPM